MVPANSPGKPQARRHNRRGWINTPRGHVVPAMHFVSLDRRIDLPCRSDRPDGLESVIVTAKRRQPVVRGKKRSRRGRPSARRERCVVEIDLIKIRRTLVVKTKPRTKHKS